MTDNIKEVVPMGRYAILDDHKSDIRVTKTNSYNQGSEDGKPQVEFYTATVGYSGGPNLIWRGHDLGAKPYNGYGITLDTAVIDLLHVINRQVENRMDVTDLIKILVNEKREPVEMPGEMPS